MDRTVARLLFSFSMIASVLAVAANSAGAWPLSWKLEEFQPNVANGGRADTIAVNPSNNSEMFVASESGGLFRTSDAGLHWSHVDALNTYYTAAVVYVTPSILLTTTSDLFTAANDRGGIWRSTDDGASWTHIVNPATPPGTSARFSATEISIAPDTGVIYVATSFGIAMSSDQGASWTLSQPYGSNQVYAVAAQSGNLVITSDGYSIVRSTDGGSTWSAPNGPGVSDWHGLARSPFDSNTFYAVDGATQLWFSESGGASWTQIASAPPGGGGCGGIGFVKPILASQLGPGLRHLTLWFGNRCGLARLPAVQISGTKHFDYSGTWIASNLDHSDTRDLAFATGPLKFGFAKTPILLGTDGGLHRTSDGGTTWTFTGGGPNGYNALQITETKGQWIDNSGQYHLYFGTQDNNTLASGDAGVSWPGSQVVCCEGFFIEMEKHVASAADSRVNFVSCSGCADLTGGDLFAGLTNWPDPPGAWIGNPTIISKSLHDQTVSTDAGFMKGMAISQNLGANWTQYAAFPEDHLDIARLTRGTVLFHGLKFSVAAQYQAIRTGYDVADDLPIDHLVRLTKNFGAATASVYYPAMNGFGGLGIDPTMFAWYEVFGADPQDIRHLIAPDVINRKMMESKDGGDNWTEIPSLTSLVTESGGYAFRSGIFPLASHVSFFRDDPTSVAVGTQANGLFVSRDRGATWIKVPGSERATAITSVEWDTPTTAFVSTYGRGLWRLTGYSDLPHLQPLCAIVPCLLKYIDKGDPAPDRFDPGIVVFEGVILGARAEGGVIRELFVSPHSSVGFVGRQARVTIVRANRPMGFRGIRGAGLLTPPRGARLTGIAFDKRGGFFGALFTRTAIPLTEKPTPVREQIADQRTLFAQNRSPTADKPYLSLSMPPKSGGQVEPGDPIVLTGVRMPPGATLEVLLDRRAVQRAEVTRDGTFRVVLRAPAAFGLHTLTVRDAREKEPIDGTMFIVRHTDRPRRLERR